MTNMNNKPLSFFEALGFKRAIELLLEEIQDLYLSDEIQWVIGYSGGKDSTATLQLVWMALACLHSEKRVKPVHVISTDTLVENPVVANWVKLSLSKIGQAAMNQDLPFTPHRLTPDPTQSFWVNLIGRGYPAPRPWFRWCTERLKIGPAHNFVSSVVQAQGEAIMVLGTRKAESARRAQNMKKFEARRVRDLLSPNGGLPNAYIYTPIQDWSNDDVWAFLLNTPNPWGHDNSNLLELYKGASPDNECPLVMDTKTPSCGDSRFGCWVCTLVEKDKSMQAMLQNDLDKFWMAPLIEIRDRLALKDNEGKWDDRGLRDFRRMTGSVQLHNDKVVHGPYKQAVREDLLRDLLEAQEKIRELGPESVKDLELITIDELKEIRRVWVVDKNEIEDRLPLIYEEVLSKPYPGRQFDDNKTFGAPEMQILRDLCGDDELHYQLCRDLLNIERRYSSMLRRAGLFEQIEKAFHKGAYDDETDAILRARNKRDALDKANMKLDCDIQESSN